MIDWRDMFIRYERTVGAWAGTAFVQDGNWTPEEWAAIQEAIPYYAGRRVTYRPGWPNKDVE